MASEPNVTPYRVVAGLAPGYGANWHPNLKTHQIMADRLPPELRRLRGAL